MAFRGDLGRDSVWRADRFEVGASRRCRKRPVCQGPAFARAPRSCKLRARGSASYRLGPVPERPALQDPSDDLG